MISLINPEDQFPADMQAIAADIAKAHAQFTHGKIMDALIARFGEMPTPEQVSNHVICAVDQDKVSHYVWVEKRPVVGEELDLSDVLCSIAPPDIFNPYES